MVQIDNGRGGVDTLTCICGKRRSIKRDEQTVFSTAPWGQIRIICFDPEISTGNNLAGLYIGCFNVIPLYLGVSY